MIKILHGENIVESRKALTELATNARSEGTETVSLDGAKTTLTQVRSNLESSSLFGKSRLVIIENLLTGQKSATKTKILQYLAEQKFDNDLVLWEPKEVSKKVLNQLPKVEIRFFRVAPVIFRFLDSLQPNNNKEMLRLLKEAKAAEEQEMIFYMIIRQIRLLLLAKDSDNRSLAYLPSWQQKKFLSQSKFFTLDQLKKIHQQLLEIDFSQKTSGDPYSLSSRLDLLIASL